MTPSEPCRHKDRRTAVEGTQPHLHAKRSQTLGSIPASGQKENDYDDRRVHDSTIAPHAAAVLDGAGRPSHELMPWCCVWAKQNAWQNAKQPPGP